MSAPGEEVKLEKVRARHDVTVASIDAVVAGPPRIRGGLAQLVWFMSMDIRRASASQRPLPSTAGPWVGLLGRLRLRV